MSDAAPETPAAGRLFSPATMLWVVLVGVFAFSAFAALSAYAPDLRTGADGRAHALSKSAVGFSGLEQLLRDDGAPVLISRGPPPQAQPSQGVLVLTPSEETAPKAVDAIRYSNVILLVLPKWDVAAQPLRQGWVYKTGLIDPNAVAAPLKDLAAATTIQRRKGTSQPVLHGGRGPPMCEHVSDWAVGPTESLQTLSGADWIPVLSDDKGKAVLALSRKRPVFVLADPDLFNTHGLVSLVTARTAVRILQTLSSGGPVIFDVTLNGFTRGRSLLRLSLEPPFLGVTLCLLAAAGMMGLQAIARFGPPLRPPPAIALGKRALADNSAALVRMARREARMAGPYADLVRDDAARAVGAPRDLDPAELEGVLDRLGKAKGAGAVFTELAARARAATSAGELMRTAKDLFQWKAEITGER